MRTLLAALAIVGFAWPVAAQSLEATDHGYVWRQGKEFVRFDRGRWTAGIDGGAEVQWGMFFWHDRWVYETLSGGRVDSGPTLGDDGALTMAGTFSAQQDSPPMKYACRITPTSEGLRVRCELEKSAPLKLTNGVWLHLSAAGDKFRGSERVWFPPSAHGTVASVPDATADRALLELRDGRAVCFTMPGYRQMDREGGSKSHTFRFNLLPGDFEVPQKAVLEYTVSFADLPAHFPGQIEPSRQPLAIQRVTPSGQQVARYQRLQLRVDLGATYDNPFDPDQVRLDATFTAPSGKQLAVPGYFAVEHRRRVADQAEVMIPEGGGAWLVRFTPREVGQYRWQLRLRDRSGEVTGGAGSFVCTPGKRPGFVGTSKVDPHYLAFDDGQGYFAIGHNLPIYHTTGQLGDEAMRKFAAAGENFNRWWMSSSGLGIEWTDRLGWYRQDVAARIDMVLDVAEELNLYYMMCMDTHQDFREEGWLRNPFNARNGGPCQTPRDWFTSPEARRHYRNRLRYTVARWGYSPHVLCWEFGNEMEGWADSPDEVKLPWHKEMAAYLHAIDPFGHLVTTSFWSKTGPEAYWELDEIDIVQTHCYTNDDANVGEAVRRYCLHQWQRFAKPHIFGEFGIRSHDSTADKDPEGWALHNALWAGLTGFAAGGPMPWWHESYIDQLDLYFHFAALANFARDLPLGTARWEPAETTSPEFVDKDRPPQTRDVVIGPQGGWGKPEADEFAVGRDGRIEGDRQPHQLLHGQSHRDIRRPPTFVVTYPKPGKFVVRVGRVSGSGLLKVWIDDQLKLERELPCGEGLGKESTYRPQWKLWETTYDESIAVDVPAGKHRIRVENLGRDWVTVNSYAFTGCQVLDKPDLLVAAIRTDRVTVIWLQNRDSSWYNHARDAVRSVQAFRLGVHGFADRRYRVEWWDTWKGNLVRTDQIEARDGQLTLSVPELKSDAAVKIRAE